MARLFSLRQHGESERGCGGSALRSGALRLPHKVLKPRRVRSLLGYNANILMCIPRLLGKEMVFNIAGLEWERAKFGRRQQFSIKSLYLLATVGASHIIIDHEKLKPYVPSRYQDKVVLLTYGANEPIVVPWNVSTIAEHARSTGVADLLPLEYWLVLARLEPDQHVATIVNAYLRGTSTKQKT